MLISNTDTILPGVSATAPKAMESVASIATLRVARLGLHPYKFHELLNTEATQRWSSCRGRRFVITFEDVTVDIIARHASIIADGLRSSDSQSALKVASMRRSVAWNRDDPMLSSSPNDFVLIDLISQRVAVRDWLGNADIPFKLSWLESRGKVTTISRSPGFPHTYLFESRIGLSAAFYFNGNGDFVFVGDNTTFQ